jgi:hypothetical protein
MNFQGHSEDDTAVCMIKFSENEEITAQNPQCKASKKGDRP